jgi:hypothetical protein
MWYNNHMSKTGSPEGANKINRIGLGLGAFILLGATASVFSIADHAFGWDILSGDINPVHPEDRPATLFHSAWGEKSWTLERYVSTIGYYAVLGAGAAKHYKKEKLAQSLFLIAGGSGFIFSADGLHDALDHASVANMAQWGGATVASLAGTASRARALAKNNKA